MTIRDCALVAVLWLGLAGPAAAQTVSFTFDDGPTLDPTPLMTPAERNEALLAHLRTREVQAMFRARGWKIVSPDEAFEDAAYKVAFDALMSMMTPDGVFEASGGPAVDGERHEGQQAVRAAYAAVFEQYPDAHWGNARHFVTGDRGVSEWTFTGTLKDGRRVEVTGCDVFTFRDGKIAVKNSFRKNRPPIG